MIVILFLSALLFVSAESVHSGLKVKYVRINKSNIYIYSKGKSDNLYFSFPFYNTLSQLYELIYNNGSFAYPII